MYIDTHCHIDDKKFEDKSQIIKNATDNGVEILINMGCNVESSNFGKSLSEKYSGVYFGAGFHPSDANDFNQDALNEIRTMCFHEKCVAVGEIGLDYHWDGYDKTAQANCFISQIELANQMDLPVSIHSRDATEDMVKILKAHKINRGGVMHCFSGSRETAKILLDLGLYVSFAGTLTFKNANNLVEVAKFVPEDRCLTETDSPYLAPTPYRGERNEPAYVSIVAKRLAEIKGRELSEMAKIVLANAKRLFFKMK